LIVTFSALNTPLKQGVNEMGNGEAGPDLELARRGLRRLDAVFFQQSLRAFALTSLDSHLDDNSNRLLTRAALL
jgi:hypothetical protein